MDLGVMDLNGLVGSDACIESSDAETKQKWYYTGSGFLKQERSEAAADYHLRSFKVAKTEQMLSFSSPKSESVTLPNFYHHPSSPCSRNTGYGFGGLNAESMHGVLTGVRSPFTPSQWMELEHQALIYKYINSNVPIPSNLLIPIRRALESAGGIYGFSGGPLRPGTLGWGAFHFGYSNNTDPEPGRCRRTDGKKWRCSRDAVADQKYCERHVNRGRHRSRKPVEGQKGHSVSGTTATTAAKLMAVASSTSEMVVPGGGASSNIGLSQHPQLKSLQPSAPNPCASSHHMNRFHMPELKENPYEESSRAEFGHVYSDSLLNPLHKSSSLITCRNYGNRENELQHSVHQFLDDKTLLSISIPETASDFMSTTSSSTNHKLALSPLRLSREMDSEMGFQVGSATNGSSQRQVNWIPISWDASVGGPLGEVLHSSSNSSPRLAPSSPTGVLQRTNNTFWSLSNSSAGSSPRAESHVTREGARPCNDLLAGLVTI